MKRLFSVLMLLVVLSHASLNVCIALYYHLNKVYITQELCENRDNPKLHCNGHCYLAKQLKKAEESEQKQTQNLIKEREEVISNKVNTLLGEYFPDYTITTILVPDFTLVQSGSKYSLLKPPTV